MADKTYCYPSSDVLVNLLDCRDERLLRKKERLLTSMRLIELLHQPISGSFDFEHLKAIHRHIFQDVYGWAGMVRTADIAKGNMFCKTEFIERQAQALFDQLRFERDAFSALGPEEMAERLAYYLAEINALHPFREGNGRAQREFIRSLAVSQGYVLHYERIEKDEMLDASRESFLCEYGKMERLIRRCMEKL